MQREVVTTDRIAPPVGPFSAAVLGGVGLILSGQIAQDPSTGRLLDPSDAARQTEHVLRNVAAVLEAAGRTLEDVLRVGVFLTDMDDFQAVNEVYARHFRPPFPARTTVAVRALPLGARVEVEVFAR